MESEVEFFARRAQEARCAAYQAKKGSARRAHRKLAEYYEAALGRARAAAGIEA